MCTCGESLGFTFLNAQNDIRSAVKYLGKPWPSTPPHPPPPSPPHSQTPPPTSFIPHSAAPPDNYTAADDSLRPDRSSPQAACHHLAAHCQRRTGRGRYIGRSRSRS
ncbi:hypothetical protein PMIN07_006250 [Paraphaeosphaeria minitans]